MGKPTEEDLRRAKDGLQRVVSDQQRAIGVPDPGGRVVDDFIGPILEKVARDDGKRGQDRPVDESSGVATDLAPDEVQVSEMGTYEWDLGTDQVTAREGSWQPSAEDRLREFVRGLFRIPETAAALRKIGQLCSRHVGLGGPDSTCVWCSRREEALHLYVKKCAQKYGYGRHKKAPLIMVGGK